MAADTLLRDLTVYDTEGTRWAVLQRWTKEAAQNGGGGGGGSGTVTSIPDGNTNGVAWTVATRTTIPTFTFTLGAITPTSVVSTGSITGLNITGSGVNTGDQNLFGSFIVSGQTTVTASANPTALTLVAGTNVTLTTDNTAKSITITAASSIPTVNVQSGNYTLVLGDAWNEIQMTSASANTLTVPPNSSVAFAVGTQVTGWTLGAGQTTFAPGSGVTLSSRGAVLTSAGQYAAWLLEKTAADTWVLTGDIGTGGGGASFEGAEVQMSSNQTITSGSGTVLTWATELYDVGSYWNAGAPTVFTITTTGKYRLTLNARFAANGTGMRQAVIGYDGAGVAASSTTNVGAGNATEIIVTVDLIGVAGKEFRSSVYHEAGGNLDILAGVYTRFSIEKIG